MPQFPHSEVLLPVEPLHTMAPLCLLLNYAIRLITLGFFGGGALNETYRTFPLPPPTSPSSLPFPTRFPN